MSRVIRIPRDSEGKVRLGELLSEGAKTLAASGSETPRLDGELILAHVLAKSGMAGNLSRAWLLAHPDNIIEKKAAKAFAAAVTCRAKGLPVAYITGKKAFWKHEFEVCRDVLIPKPDTETLVERAEEALRGLFAQKGKQEGGQLRVLDAFTGSGCVAISLKADFPSILVAGADISRKALSLAKKNERKILGAKAEGEPVAWMRRDLRKGLPAPPFHSDEPRTRWDIIVANPPYVPSSEARKLLSDGRSEPLLALDGGEDGLSLIRPLILSAAKALSPEGVLLIEAGEYNADAAAAYFKEAGFANILIMRDLAGQKRVVEGRLCLSL